MTNDETPQINIVKPSELPEHAVIDDAEHGRFIKENNGRWAEISPPYRELALLVWDRGRPNQINKPANFMPEKSDDYFKDFEIISVPQGWYPPYIDKTVTYWYDLGHMHIVRKTLVHEVIADHPDLREEDIASAKPMAVSWSEFKTLKWRDIPRIPNYETRIDHRGDIVVRNKKTKNLRHRRENGFFVLSYQGKQIRWCEGELGTAWQIHQFYETGKVDAYV